MVLWVCRTGLSSHTGASPDNYTNICTGVTSHVPWGKVTPHSGLWLAGRCLSDFFGMALSHCASKVYFTPFGLSAPLEHRECFPGELYSQSHWGQRSVSGTWLGSLVFRSFCYDNLTAGKRIVLEKNPGFMEQAAHTDFSMSRKPGKAFKVLKPWTHKHKKTFSRNFFNNILPSVRSTKRLIKTVFRKKNGQKDCDLEKLKEGKFSFWIT